MVTLCRGNSASRRSFSIRADPITVVLDRKDEGHAVLTVKTDRGEYILDNQAEEILPWSKTGYRFVKRQSQYDPNVWVSPGDPRLAPPPRRYGRADRTVILNSK
jgi:predicted transglutaminase-like cysteine proteinase